MRRALLVIYRTSATRARKFHGRSSSHPMMMSLYNPVLSGLSRCAATRFTYMCVGGRPTWFQTGRFMHVRPDRMIIDARGFKFASGAITRKTDYRGMIALANHLVQSRGYFNNSPSPSPLFSLGNIRRGTEMSFYASKCCSNGRLFLIRH